MKKIFLCLIVVLSLMLASCFGERSRSPANNPVSTSEAITQGETVFALWEPDGYYYPGVVAAIIERQARISFLDGDEDLVPVEHIINLDTALNTLALEGNWEFLGLFYTGNLSSREPMIMLYDDGDVEQVQLVQLRGARR